MIFIILRHFYLLIIHSIFGCNSKKMLANSSKYAVKAVVYIVSHSSPQKRLLVRDIAQAIDAPQPFLSKILQQLSTKNYLTSMKGPHGGFYVTDEQLQMSVMDIIIEIEGKDRLNQCALNFENCNSENPCPIHDFISKTKEELRSSLSKIKVIDLKNKEYKFLK